MIVDRTVPILFNMKFNVIRRHMSEAIEGKDSTVEKENEVSTEPKKDTFDLTKGVVTWKRFFEAITTCTGAAYVLGFLIFMSYFLDKGMPLSSFEVIEPKDYVNFFSITTIFVISAFGIILLPATVIFDVVGNLQREKKLNMNCSKLLAFVLYVALIVVYTFAIKSAFKMDLSWKVGVVFFALLGSYILISWSKFVIAFLVVIASLLVAIRTPEVFIKASGFGNINKYIVFTDKPNGVFGSAFTLLEKDTEFGKVWVSSQPVHIDFMTKTNIVFGHVSSAMMKEAHVPAKRDGIFLFDNLPHFKAKKAPNKPPKTPSNSSRGKSALCTPKTPTYYPL